MRAIAFLACLVAGAAFAQQDGHSTVPLPQVPRATATILPGSAVQDTARFSPGEVKVLESARIKALMAEYTATKRPLKGYRVQIFLGDRGQAENTRRAFLLQHPDIPAYLSYLAPNFRVRVGDLRDRVGAEILRGSLKAEFPGLYVVPDNIEPPAIVAPGPLPPAKP
ncbi:MAG: hypothetical protein M9900_12635 [Flavobacteriales bacterium]|nr:hypothetical protein [Flavobacteriales bacterium]